MKSTRTKTAYIQAADSGKPCMSLSQLAAEVADQANLDRLAREYSGLNSHPGLNRRKVRVTVTVEYA